MVAGFRDPKYIDSPGDCQYQKRIMIYFTGPASVWEGRRQLRLNCKTEPHPTPPKDKQGWGSGTLNNPQLMHYSLS